MCAFCCDIQEFKINDNHLYVDGSFMIGAPMTNDTRLIPKLSIDSSTGFVLIL